MTNRTWEEHKLLMELEALANKKLKKSLREIYGKEVAQNEGFSFEIKNENYKSPIKFKNS